MRRHGFVIFAAYRILLAALLFGLGKKLMEPECMTPLKRGWFALLSMVAVWICSAALCFLFHLKALLALWIGVFALATYLFFALPVVARVPRHVQLRLWYLLMLLSVVWALGLLSLFFREFPIQTLAISVENLFGYWAIGYALASSGLYLILLRSRGRAEQKRL